LETQRDPHLILPQSCLNDGVHLKIAANQHISSKEAYSRILEHLKQNADLWRGPSAPNVPYGDPLCRIAYLYGIVPANANLVEKIFEESQELADHVDEIHQSIGVLDICAFGGGPGTELLAVAKWLERRQLTDPLELNFLLVDKINEWVGTWRGLRRETNKRLSQSGNPSVTISGDFLQIDVNSESAVVNFNNWDPSFSHHIYIFSYIISEIFSDFEYFHEFVELVADRAPMGAKFLFVERAESRWAKKIEEISSDCNLDLSVLGRATSNMDSDEQSSTLGQMLTNVGRNPRTTWDAYWYVGTKVP